MNETNERMIRRFGHLTLCSSKKITKINFLKKKKTQNFVRTNFEHFNIYRNEKYILVLGKKNNIFQFYEDEKHTKIFARTNFKFFNI